MEYTISGQPRPATVQVTMCYRHIKRRHTNTELHVGIKPKPPSTDPTRQHPLGQTPQHGQADPPHEHPGRLEPHSDSMSSKGGGGALYVQAPSNRSGYYEYSLPLRSSGGSGRSKHPPFLQLSQAAGEGGGSFGHAAGSGGEQQHGKKPLVLTKELQEKIAEQVFTQGSLL